MVSGTNVLQFFNTLSNGSGIIDYQSFASNATETTLPVNYVGTNEPSDTNLYFCDFTLTNPPVYNTHILPTVSVTSPYVGQVFTNGESIVVQGIAGTNQWTGLARVRLDFLPESGIYENQPFGNDAIGTTNWYLPVSSDFGINGKIPPGRYNIRAVSQDGYGILAVADANSYFLVLANLVLATNGVGTIQISPAPVSLTNGTYMYSRRGLYHFGSPWPRANLLHMERGRQRIDNSVTDNFRRFGSGVDGHLLFQPISRRAWPSPLPIPRVTWTLPTVSGLLPAAFLRGFR